MIADARLAQAEAALEGGDPRRAFAIGAAVLAEMPAHVPALLVTGRAALAAGIVEAGRTLLLGALRHSAVDAHVFAQLPRREMVSHHFERGLEHLHARRSDPAIGCFEAALREQPQNWHAQVNLGVAFKQAGRVQEAEDAYRRALSMAPDHPQLLGNLANAVVLRPDGVEEAIALQSRRIALEPREAQAWLGLGQALRRAGRTAEAEALCREAIMRDPEHVAAHVTLAMLLLTRGAWAEGFREYEWRRRLPAFRPGSDPDPVPEWEGQPIGQRTILLHAEQGLGDVILFARFAASLAREGAKLWIACDSQLVRVMASVPGIAGACDNDGPMPPHALQAPLLSVPYLGAICDVAADGPYLTADPALVAKWRTRLPAACGLRVGVVWAGNASFPGDAERSLNLSMLLPMVRALPHLTFVALQKGDGRRDLETLCEPLPGNFHDVGDGIGDFADTAAIMASLDVILCADSAPAHLAGALGRPTWVLLPPFGDWRWGETGEATPWYPQMRLWRRAFGEPWSAVLARVQAGLSEVAERRWIVAADPPHDGATASDRQPPGDE
ncbi:tetratricopeptide repeat protein [Sphingomonas sp. CJ20]